MIADYVTKQIEEIHLRMLPDEARWLVTQLKYNEQHRVTQDGGLRNSIIKVIEDVLPVKTPNQGSE